MSSTVVVIRAVNIVVTYGAGLDETNISIWGGNVGGADGMVNNGAVVSGQDTMSRLEDRAVKIWIGTDPIVTDSFGKQYIFIISKLSS